MPAQRGTTATAAFSAASVANPTNLAPALPAGYQTGDLLLCYTACRSATPTVATPAGWTQLANVTATNGRLALFGKIAASTSETAPTVTWTGLTTGNSGTPCGAQTAAFSAMSFGLVDLTGTVENLAASTTAAASGTGITTTTNDDLVLALSTRLDDAGTWTAPAGFTLLAGVGTTSGADFAQAWAFQIKTTAGAVAPADFALAGGSSFASSGVLVALRSVTAYTDTRTGTVTGSGTSTESWAQTTGYDATIDADSPVSHWKLGNTATAVDRKGITNLPATNGPITATTGLAYDSGDAANTFAAASSQRFSTPAGAGLGTPYDTPAWSIEAWVKRSAPTATHAIVKRSFQGLQLTSTGRPVALMPDNTQVFPATFTIATDTLAHLVATYDGTTLILYVNGAEQARGAATGSNLPTNPPGIASAGAASFFNGTIDEVAWYATALSPTRVLAHYQAGLPPAGGPTYNDSQSGTTTATGSAVESAAYADAQTTTTTAWGSGVETYQPSGTAYTDTQTGAITASGTTLETTTRTDTASGAITSSGTALDAASATDATTGTTASTGTATENAAHADARTATATATATGLETASTSDTQAGAVTAVGTSAEAHTHASAATGALTATGTSTDDWTIGYTDTNTGVVTSSGTALETADTADTAAGVLALTGTGSETYQPPAGDTTYTDATTGTVASSGTALEHAAANDLATGATTAVGAGPDAHTRDTAATGTLAATGNSLETAAYTDAKTGTLTATGTALELYQPPTVHTDTAVGALTATGTATDSLTATEAATGNLTATGAGLETSVGTDTAAGALAITGVRLETATFADAAAGAITLTGTSTDLWHPPGPQHVDAAAGQFTASGTGLELRTYEDTQLDGLALDGTSEHSATFADACPGTIRTHGTGTRTDIQRRLRPGHPTTSEPVPPYPAWPTPGTLRRPRRGAHPVGAAGRQRTPA